MFTTARTKEVNVKLNLTDCVVIAISMRANVHIAGWLTMTIKHLQKSAVSYNLSHLQGLIRFIIHDARVLDALIMNDAQLLHSIIIPDAWTLDTSQNMYASTLRLGMRPTKTHMH